ncbi:MAG: NADH-quinone oxidoreductase subunit D [Candidatus Hydrothermarchaeales archaeon]
MSEVSEMILNFGPQHPSTHGVLRIKVKLDGEIVREAVPILGYLHRAQEKIAENRTYMEYLPLTDRLDYVSSMTGNHAYSLAVEELLDVEVPRRADFIRVIVSEFQRIASHCLWLSAFGLDIGAITPLFYAFREREYIMDLFEAVCGARLTYSYIVPGGVRYDLPENFIESARKIIKLIRPKIDEYEDLLAEAGVFLMRTKGVGVIKPEDAINLGITGPILRGCGVEADLRKMEPYSVYDEIDFEVQTWDGCDVFSTYKVRMNEMRESLNIIEQALDMLPKNGKIKAKLPRILKPPAGDAYGRVESPRGELGFYVVSDGTERPYRVRIRSPAFINISAIPFMVKDTIIADFIAILGVIDVVMGEADK